MNAAATARHEPQRRDGSSLHSVALAVQLQQQPAAEEGGGMQVISAPTAASFKLCVLLSTLEDAGRAPVDPHLSRRLENTCAFLRDLGLDAVLVSPRAADGTCDDTHTEVVCAPSSVLVVCVYVLRSKAAALSWCATQARSSRLSPRIPFTRQLLVVDGSANDAHVYVPPSPAVPVWLRDTVYSESSEGLCHYSVQ
jgi:hypothetical protein